MGSIRDKVLEDAESQGMAGAALYASPVLSGGAEMRCIDLLRADEGDSVTILCDNPGDFDMSYNVGIDCNGGWTGWRDRHFTGQTVADCLTQAVAAREAIGDNHPRVDGIDKCTVPPPGWECSRFSGHDGPCAAFPPPSPSEAISPPDALPLALRQARYVLRDLQAKNPDQSAYGKLAQACEIAADQLASPPDARAVVEAQRAAEAWKVNKDPTDAQFCAKQLVNLLAALSTATGDEGSSI